MTALAGSEEAYADGERTNIKIVQLLFVVMPIYNYWNVHTEQLTLDPSQREGNF